MESNPPSADIKEFAEKITALACGNSGSGNFGLVNFISVGLMIFCTLSLLFLFEVRSPDGVSCRFLLLKKSNKLSFLTA